jgi:hypothetical protein
MWYLDMTNNIYTNTKKIFITFLGDDEGRVQYAEVNPLNDLSIVDNCKNFSINFVNNMVDMFILSLVLFSFVCVFISRLLIIFWRQTNLIVNFIYGGFIACSQFAFIIFFMCTVYAFKICFAIDTYIEECASGKKLKKKDNSPVNE